MSLKLRHALPQTEDVDTECGRPSSLRCFCGSLLARLVPEGVELKCRRCKRQVVLPLDKKERAVRTLLA